MAMVPFKILKSHQAPLQKRKILKNICKNLAASSENVKLLQDGKPDIAVYTDALMAAIYKLALQV
jgi:TRAP-type uncharacterized transport system substrate-binding protein